MTNSMYPAWSKESAALRMAEAPGLPEAASPNEIIASGDGKGVRVAVIDSGIDASHPALDDCVEVDAGVVAVMDGELAELKLQPHDDVYGHGTACAGIIHDLAPAARITSVRVLDAGLGGKVAAFHAGLEWTIDKDFDVINLSLGSRKREWALAFYELCDRASFAGSVVITAANNSQGESYPSLYSSAFSVACTTTTDPERFHVNPEPPTEFLARGIDVPLLWRNGGRYTGTGNSFAAPHIAGLVARILGKWPDLRPFQLKSLLWAAAANVQESTAPAIAGRITQMQARSTLVSGRQSRTLTGSTRAAAHAG